MGSASEARRAEGRYLSRHSSQSHSIRMLNLYLLQVATSDASTVSNVYFQCAQPLSASSCTPHALLQKSRTKVISVCLQKAIPTKESRVVEDLLSQVAVARPSAPCSPARVVMPCSRSARLPKRASCRASASGVRALASRDAMLAQRTAPWGAWGAGPS